MRTIVHMRVIADTNTFLAVALNEPEKPEVIKLTAGHQLFAPDVLPFEIGNALSALIKRKKLNIEEAIIAWDTIQLIPVDLRSINIRNAIKIADQFNIYAYDAYFIECANIMRSPLITLDRRLGIVAKDLGIQLLEIPK